MVNFKPIISFIIIGVLQVCTANPFASEEIEDATKLFSADELQRAKNAGISDRQLVQLKTYALTFEQTIKLVPLQNTSPNPRVNVTFDFMTKVCEILVPEHNTALNRLNPTNAQNLQLHNLTTTVSYLPNNEQLLCVRMMICAYISQPDLHEMDARSFGLELVPYMKIRFLKMKAENGTGVERVKLAQEMCCLFKDRYIPGYLVDRSNFSDFPDEELNEFGQHWNQFEITNTSKSLENVCDFLHAKNPSDKCEKRW